MKFYSIGHITKDLKPCPHVSGSVAYSAVVAKMFGYDATIVTKCELNHPYIKQLEARGIKVINLPGSLSKSNTGITTFDNVFDARGYRNQVISTVQPKITSRDLIDFSDIVLNDIVFVGSVIGEISTELLLYISNKYQLTFICQGYFRRIIDKGYILSERWKDLSRLRQVSFMSISDEDITFDGRIDYNLLRVARKISGMTLYTLGKNGSEIFEKGKKKMIIRPFVLYPEELIELSGCGDVYTAVYVFTYKECLDAKLSAVFASFITSLKIRSDLDKENFGLKSCVSKKSIIDFINNNSIRCAKFLKSNGVYDEKLLVNFANNYLVN